MWGSSPSCSHQVWLRKGAEGQKGEVREWPGGNTCQQCDVRSQDKLETASFVHHIEAQLA